MIRKLLCAIVLASTALAQNLAIPLPHAGANVAAGSAMLVQVARPTPTTDFEDISIVIIGASCEPVCFDDSYGLGHFVLYNGPYNPTSTNSAGHEYQNFTVTVPNAFDGTMQLRVVHSYLEGVQNYLKTEIVKTTVNVSGASG